MRLTVFGPMKRLDEMWHTFLLFTRVHRVLYAQLRLERRLTYPSTEEPRPMADLAGGTLGEFRTSVWRRPGAAMAAAPDPEFGATLRYIPMIEYSSSASQGGSATQSLHILNTRAATWQTLIAIPT
jgi:hypothetical protein